MSRSSPTHPISCTGWSWSSEFIAPSARLSAIPSFMRRARPSTCVAFPRITPPLSQYRNLTSLIPAFRQAATIWSGVVSDELMDISHPLLRRRRRVPVNSPTGPMPCVDEHAENRGLIQRSLDEPPSTGRADPWGSPAAGQPSRGRTKRASAISAPWPFLLGLLQIGLRPPLCRRIREEFSISRTQCKACISRTTACRRLTRPLRPTAPRRLLGRNLPVNRRYVDACGSFSEPLHDVDENGQDKGPDRERQPGPVVVCEPALTCA